MRKTEGVWGRSPQENFATTPSTLAIKASNALFHRQKRLGKDIHYQPIQSLIHPKKHHTLKCTVPQFLFHSERSALTEERACKECTALFLYVMKLKLSLCRGKNI